MLNVEAAKTALLNAEPSINKVDQFVIYRNVYLFRVVFISDDEANYDPFFSVDMNTGEVRDFSVLNDGDIDEIADLFMKKKGTA